MSEQRVVGKAVARSLAWTENRRSWLSAITLWRMLVIILTATIVVGAMPHPLAEIPIGTFIDQTGVAPWTASAGADAQVELLRGVGRNGEPALRLTYSLPTVDSYAAAELTLSSPRHAEALALWAKSSPNARLSVDVSDTEGRIQTYHLSRPLSAMGPDDWQQHVLPLSGAGENGTRVPITAVSVRAGNPLMPATGEVLIETVALMPRLELRLDPLVASSAEPTAANRSLGARLAVNIHTTRNEEQLDIAQAAGFTWVRMDLFWHMVERERGVYNFDAYKSFLGALSQRGMKALLILDYGNPLYQGDQTTPPTTPEAIAGFRRFSEAAARELSGYGAVFEVWNEPNHPRFWPPAPDPVTYATLAKETIAGVKAGDPTALVLVGSLSKFDYEFIRATILEGGATGADAISVHPYLGVPEDVTDHLVAMRSLVAELLPGTPVWVTEWGYSSMRYGDGHSDQARWWQAVMASRQLLSCWAADCPLSVYYDLQDDGENPMELEHNFGLVDRSHREKTALQAVRTLTEAARDRELAGVIDTGLSGLNGLRLTGTGGPVVVLWLDTPSGRADIRLPQGLQATDMLGNRLEFSPSGVTGDVRLTITEEGGPVYLR